jgi:hypothetical protein
MWRVVPSVTVIVDIASPAERGSFVSGVDFACVRTQIKYFNADRLKRNNRAEYWFYNRRTPDLCCRLALDMLVFVYSYSIMLVTNGFFPTRDLSECRG